MHASRGNKVSKALAEAVTITRSNGEGKVTFSQAKHGMAHEYSTNFSLLTVDAVTWDGSIKIILPFFPVGTMERVDIEGEIATARTLARIISNVPPCRSAPLTFHLVPPVHQDSLKEIIYCKAICLVCSHASL
jgi:hypothetical protein